MGTSMILEHIADLRSLLQHHPLYKRMTSTQNVALFMEHHVWAVWDFMSLLKALQRNLTRVEVPWYPIGDAEVRFLINEIVVGEESDVDKHGTRMSHFEMYLSAMREVGASTAAIETFIVHLRNGVDVASAMAHADAPSASRAFVSFTMDVIGRGNTHEIASVFTFGREEIIPTMFLGILDTLEISEGASVDNLRYYLERHIEVDGDHHGPLAERMVELLCQDNEQRYSEAAAAAQQALQHRIALWNAVAEACAA